MIPHFVIDKISDSSFAIPAGAVITGYGGYKILKKQYASGLSWATTGIGIITTAAAAKKGDSDQGSSKGKLAKAGAAVSTMAAAGSRLAHEVKSSERSSKKSKKS